MSIRLWKWIENSCKMLIYNAFFFCVCWEWNRCWLWKCFRNALVQRAKTIVETVKDVTMYSSEIRFDSVKKKKWKSNNYSLIPNFEWMILFHHQNVNSITISCCFAHFSLSFCWYISFRWLGLHSKACTFYIVILIFNRETRNVCLQPMENSDEERTKKND